MPRRTNLKMSLLTSVFFVVMACTTAGQTIFVDAGSTGANNGSSWNDAFNYLQDALVAAQYGDEIHIAQGIYTPDSDSSEPNGSGDREATFQLINGVTIKGGYAGFGEQDPDARDIRLYETILSGDLAGNDMPGIDPCDLLNHPSRAENSYHVVTGSDCEESAVLDGFTITGGNANGTDPAHHRNGGGMYNYNGSLTVINCTFSENSSQIVGGGIHNFESSSMLTDCTFIGNSAGAQGGGIYNYGSPMLINCHLSGNSAMEGAGMYNYYSSPKLTNCTFSDNNSTGDYAGGMGNFGSNPTLYNCTFRGNSSYFGGGGMRNSHSSPELTNCIFSGNSVDYCSGGMYNSYESSPNLANCTFSENSARFGGGMYNYDRSNPTLTNCTFSRNSVDVYGGGIYNNESSPTITNCLFSENSARDNAGGMLNYKSSPTLTNCTFSANLTMFGRTGGIHNLDTESKPTLKNCIIWNNTPDEIKAYTAVTYSDVQGGWGGEGNIDADPCFANPGNNDYHLKSQAGRWDPNSQTWVKDVVTSPCIDAGDPNSDWRGELWPHGKRRNMGAYGGTAEASMSLSDAGNIADLNFDGLLCSRDMKLLTDKWLYESVLLAEDLSRDRFVNLTDFAVFAHHFELPARNPKPIDGALSVNINAELSWTAGRGATSHDVYFGTNNPPQFVGNQTATTSDPGTMAYITKYYWRIDEVNKWGTTPGIVWSFTTIMPPP